MQADIAPNTCGPLQLKYSMRMKWKRLYEGYYVPHIQDRLHMTPVTYPSFCEIRFRRRPHYVRHRKVCVGILHNIIMLLFICT